MRRMLLRIPLALSLLAVGCGDEALPDADAAASVHDLSGTVPGADLAGGGAGTDGGGGGGGGGDGGDGGAAGDAAVAPDAGPCVVRTCQGKTYQCGDCIDNDGDGRVDSADPDCLGACQNNEAGFHGNIPGQNNAPCKADCYFDQDTGSGNDDCEWDHRCDPNEIAPAFNPEAGCNYDPNTKISGSSCGTRFASQAPGCKSFCGPLTPNGCDCFGCCVIPPSNSMSTGVWLGSLDANGAPSCDLAHAGDPKRCKPCQIVPSCFKGCGRCQLCIGKGTVPPDCLPGADGGGGGGDAGNNVQCPGGEQACGLPGQPACPLAYYCITGCCQPIIN